MIESDCKMKMKVDVDLCMVKMKTTKKVADTITVIAETIAHKDTVATAHRKHLELSTRDL